MKSNTNEKGTQEEDDAAQSANVTKEKRNENKNDEHIRDDQDKALRFYADVVGFAKKGRFQSGPISLADRGLARGADGTELQLALNDNPAAKAYQQAMFQQHQPAAMFFTDDVKADYERIKARGTEFTMPPTEVTGSTIAMLLNDTCGNLIQLTQLIRY